MTQNLTGLGSFPQNLHGQGHPNPSLFSWSIPNPAAKPEGSNRRRPQPHPDTPKSKSLVLPHIQRFLVTTGKFSVIPTCSSSIPGSQLGILGGLAGLMVSAGAGIWDWGIRDLLTLYSLSCPWMVSRCTRVQVRAMAVLFKTLILTSVGAALGSGWAGIKQSGL